MKDQTPADEKRWELKPVRVPVFWGLHSIEMLIPREVLPVSKANEAQRSEELERLKSDRIVELELKLSEERTRSLRLLKTIKDIKSDLEICDWSCERCYAAKDMRETDIYLFIRDALKDYASSKGETEAEKEGGKKI